MSRLTLDIRMVRKEMSRLTLDIRGEKTKFSFYIPYFDRSGEISIQWLHLNNKAKPIYAITNLNNQTKQTKGKRYGTHNHPIDDYYNFIKNIWLCP